MQRNDGFIDIGEILNISDYDIMLWEQLIKVLRHHPMVKIVKIWEPWQVVFSFKWNNENYYFKYDEKYNPYNELIFNEICHDLNIDCIDYDLASLGYFKGLVSKSFLKKEAKIITGDVILKDYYGNEENLNKLSDVSKGLSLFSFNNLQDIWPALDYRYRQRDNKGQIVCSLMQSLVQTFLVDALVGQADRHEDNWQILEYLNGNVSFHPLFDNIRLMCTDIPYITEVSLKVSDYKRYFLEDNLQEFLKVSSQEFIDEFTNMIWVIKKDNLQSIFERISQKTHFEMRDWLKDYYLELFGDYLDYLEKIIETNSVKR